MTGSEVRLIELAQPDQGHNNGQLAFGPFDGFLYVGFGDGGGQGGPMCRAPYNADTLGNDAFFGKILRLDVDQNTGQAPYYGIPSGNPHASAFDGIKDEIIKVPARVWPAAVGLDVPVAGWADGSGRVWGRFGR